MASLTDRMIGAAMLNVRTYEEVEADSSATPQAMVVVVLSSLAAGIGAWRLGGVSALIGGLVAALVGWALSAGIIFLIGTKLLPEPQTRSDIGELLRTIGFAQSPGILRVLGVVPVLGWMISIAAFFWMLAATVIAVRQALDYKSTGRAVGVCLLGFVAYLVVGFLMASIFGIGGAIGGGLR